MQAAQDYVHLSHEGESNHKGRQKTLGWIKSIVVFHDSWWNANFVWLSALDKRAGEASIRAQEMVARTAIVGRELKRLQNRWNGSHHFTDYKQAKQKIADDSDIACLKTIKEKFFTIAIKTY